LLLLLLLLLLVVLVATLQQRLQLLRQLQGQPGVQRCVCQLRHSQIC
jgi:hypothetical protein